MLAASETGGAMHQQHEDEAVDRAFLRTFPPMADAGGVAGPTAAMASSMTPVSMKVCAHRPARAMAAIAGSSRI